MQVELINDFTLDEVTGGGELVNDFVSKSLNAPVVKASSITSLDNTKFYIIASCISNPTVYDLLKDKNYIILEHDYKFCKNRNPYVYNRDGVIPKEEKVNLDYYKNAKAVFCQTPFHKDLFTRNNIESNLENFELSLWSNEDLNLLEELRIRFETKRPTYAVYNHPHPWKGTSKAAELCLSMDLDYALLSNKPKRYDFVKALAQYSTLVFFPQQPETCCRLVLEAKMMGMNVLTSKNYGASTHPWFKLIGSQLNHTIRENIPIQLEKIKSYLI